MKPSSVEAMTAIRQVVMESATLNFKDALPCASVTSAGCQTSVSGKSCLSRGVDATLARCSIVEVGLRATEACSVCTSSVLLDVTSTISDTAPTCNPTST